MKKSTKNTKPAYIVNMDMIESLSDIDVAFGLAKQEAGLAISDDELVSICTKVCRELGPTVTIVDCTNCMVVRKKPWYKRFWNWLTKKR